MRHRIEGNFPSKQNRSSVNYFFRKIIFRVANFYFFSYVLTFTQNCMVVKNLVTSFNSWSFCWLQLSLFPNKVWQFSSCFTRPCPGKLYLSTFTTVTESGRFSVLYSKSVISTAKFLQIVWVRAKIFLVIKPKRNFI